MVAVYVSYYLTRSYVSLNALQACVIVGCGDIKQNRKTNSYRKEVNYANQCVMRVVVGL